MVEALVDLRRQAGAASPDHFWQLVERFRADLVNQALAILGQQADAEDVAQDSLCKAYLELSSLRDATKLGAWLRSINRCNALDHLRRRKAKREERLATGAAEILTQHDLPGRVGGSAAAETGAAEGEEIIRAVDSLPEPMRQVIVLHYWEKLTLEEVATRLSVPAGTVRSRIARADGLLLRKLSSSLRTKEPAP